MQNAPKLKLFAIVCTAGAATPIVVTAAIAGGSTIAYGTSNLIEASQDIYYGSIGDAHTVAFNPIRDTIFMGNQEAYDLWGGISTTVAGLIVPVGQTYTAAKAVGQTGKTLIGTVGKSAVKEVAQDTLVGAASSKAGSLVMDVTGDANLSRLAGLGTGILSGSKTGKALNSIDNAVSSSVKTLNHIEDTGSVSVVKSTNFDINAIRPQLKTEPNTAFFWSGRTDGVGGADIAADIAKNRGGVTLESTIEFKAIDMPEWDFNNPSSMEAWDLASGAYAEQVSGEVRAVIGRELREGNIWENVELPRLKSNPDVTKITTIDPKSGVETIIFER